MTTRSTRHLAATVLLAQALAAAAPAQAQVAAGETWQVVAVQPAPWGVASGADPLPGLVLSVTARGLQGPPPLACPGARHQFLRTPPQGLFEGQLQRPGHAPAAEQAAALGLPGGDLVTQRITCANGSFDLHRDGGDRAWLGLDNRVLQLRRTAAGRTPDATAQALLVHHLAGDLTLTPGSAASKATWLTPALLARLERWLRQLQRADEVPAIAGDPFSNTQEYPDAFTLAPARVQGDRAEVMATFTGAGIRPSRVTLQLQRQGGTWRVDDLRYPDGSRLSQLLGGA